LSKKSGTILRAMDAADAKAQYAEAKRRFRSGDPAGALNLLRELDPAPPVLLAQAECLVALGDTSAARTFCEAILAHGEDARARRILARCESAPPPAIPDTRDDDFQAIEPLVEPKRTPWIAFGAIGAIVIVIIAVAIFSYLDKPDPNRPGVRTKQAVAEVATEESRDPVAEHAAMLATRKAARDAVKQADEDARVAASKQPGYVVPPEEWDLDPATGAPAWRPGIYHQLPIPGSWFEPWQGPRTLDLYLPLAYAERPDDLFPTLSITMPHVNPGFLGLESWAEKRSVILIVVNTSTNDFHPGGNTQAQIDSMNFLSGRLRAHPTLNLVAGMSGGARMAWRAAVRWPDVFAGVLMMAHGGYDDMPLDPRIRVAFIHGRDDWNADFVRRVSTLLRKNGNEIRVQVIPGGHITAPPGEQAKMLDWMLDAARRDLESESAPDAPVDN